MTKTFYSLALMMLISVSSLFSQTQKDTIYTYLSNKPVVIDGSDSDSIWATATWHPINQVWIPFNATLKAGDFEGKYKTAWDKDFLYLLVEIKDDSLSDDHASPLQNWWDDDCVELFIDEDRSKGDHECNYNAFAYHVSMFYDAIDMNTNCSGINLKNNMKVVMDTIAEDTYRWEFAVKMYNKNFNPSNTEASRVTLVPNKLMGFSIAYCDNDESTSRENFIGSVVLTSATANESYKNANYLGTMLLVDPNYIGTSVENTLVKENKIKVFPNQSSSIVTISNNEGKTILDICSITGAVLKTIQLNSEEENIDISGFAKGSYIFRFSSKNSVQSAIVLKK